MNNHRLEGGGFKGCQLEIDCRREEARHPGSLCTPLPSRPLCFLNSPPDILGPRSAGPKTSSSGEQTPEGVLGSLFLLATARSYSGPGVVGRIRTRGRGRVQPYPRLCAAHVPSRSDESDRAHEPLLDRSKPFYDISVSKRCALLGPFSCALRACSDARDHNTTIFSSPKGEGFRPSPEETLTRRRKVARAQRFGFAQLGLFAPSRLCAFAFDLGIRLVEAAHHQCGIVAAEGDGDRNTAVDVRNPSLMSDDVQSAIRVGLVVMHRGRHHASRYRQG